MEYLYAWEKLHQAIHSLCSAGSQKERLVYAVESLFIIDPSVELPKEMISDFQEFMKKMTSKESVGDEGTIKATVNSLNETEVKLSIDKIISFYDSICRKN